MEVTSAAQGDPGLSGELSVVSLGMYVSVLCSRFSVYNEGAGFSDFQSPSRPDGFINK